MKRNQPYLTSLPGISVLLMILLFASGIFLTSCKSKRSVIKAPLKEEGAEYLLTMLDEKELKFDWFSAKFSAEYVEEKKSTDLRGQIRIRKDSIIWISFSPALGIEMVRLMITQDSILFMNRLDKVFFKGDYDFVNSFLETNLDFDMLQSLIIGNDFQFYETATFRASVDSREYRLSTTSRRKILRSVDPNAEQIPLIQNIWLDPENFKISRVDMKEYGKDTKKLEAQYRDFIELSGQLFPSKINFNLTGEKKITLNIRYSKTALNDPLRFPFTIPSSYDRIQ